MVRKEPQPCSSLIAQDEWNSYSSSGRSSWRETWSRRRSGRTSERPPQSVRDRPELGDAAAGANLGIDWRGQHRSRRRVRLGDRAVRQLQLANRRSSVVCRLGSGSRAQVRRVRQDGDELWRRPLRLPPRPSCRPRGQRVGDRLARRDRGRAQAVSRRQGQGPHGREVQPRGQSPPDTGDTGRRRQPTGEPERAVRRHHDAQRRHPRLRGP